MSPLDFGFINNPIDALLGQYSGLFVNSGLSILSSLIVIMLVVYTAKHGFTGGIVYFFLHYVAQCVIALTLLRFYNTPFGLLGGQSVSSFLPAVAEYYANIISLKQMDHLFLYIGTVLANMEQPGITDWGMIPVSWIVQFLMWVIQAIAFGSVALAFGMIGVLRLLGPLFIPWFIVPRLSFLFWNWLQSLIEYSFYRVTATAVVFVIGGAVTAFIDQVLHGNYTLSFLAVQIPKLMVIALFSVFLALRNSSVTGDLFKGTAAAGSDAFLGFLALGRGR